MSDNNDLDLTPEELLGALELLTNLSEQKPIPTVTHELEVKEPIKAGISVYIGDGTTVSEGIVNNVLGIALEDSKPNDSGFHVVRYMSQGAIKVSLDSMPDVYAKGDDNE